MPALIHCSAVQCPETHSRGHSGQVNVPDVVRVLGGHHAFSRYSGFRWHRSRRFLEDPPDRRRAEVQAANDVGWEWMSDGTYRAWISEYDARHRFNPKTQNRIKQEYAFHAVRRQQVVLGRTVERRMLDTGEIEVVIGGYR